MILNTRRPSRTGTPRGKITVRTADISVARMTKTPAIVASTRSAITRSSAHQLARGLLDAVSERGVDREGLGELLDAEAGVDGQGQGKDQIARVRRDDGSSHDHVRGAEGDHLHEAILEAHHLGARVGRERKLAH